MIGVFSVLEAVQQTKHEDDTEELKGEENRNTSQYCARRLRAATVTHQIDGKGDAHTADSHSITSG